MNKLLLLLAVVAAASAMPADSDLNLLKRLLGALKNEKRETNYINFNQGTERLTVSLVARAGVTDRKGHHVYVTKPDGSLVYEVKESRYSDNGSGFSNTYDLSSVSLNHGVTYTVKACEVKTDDSEDRCNTRTFTREILVGK